MSKWQYLVVYVVMTPDFQFMVQVGSKILEGNQVWEHMNSLGQDGWELVTVVERIGAWPPISKVQNTAAVFGAMMAGQSTLTVTQHKPVTLGYFYHFKREIIPNTQPLTPKSP